MEGPDDHGKPWTQMRSDLTSQLKQTRAFAMMVMEPRLVGALDSYGHSLTMCFRVDPPDPGQDPEERRAHAAAIERIADMAQVSGMRFHVTMHDADGTGKTTMSHRSKPSHDAIERRRLAVETMAGLDASLPGWRDMRWADGAPRYAPDGEWIPETQE